MPNKSRGFTLIEVLIVLTVAGILLAVVVPSFRTVIERSRVSTEVNAFVSDLQFARSEAIKQGIPVSLCASTNGTTCSTENTWHKGWLVFSNVTGTGTMQSGDVILRTRPAFKAGDTLVADPAITALTYNRDGFALLTGNASGATLLSLRTVPTVSSITRCISMNRIGYQTIYKSGQGGCT